MTRQSKNPQQRAEEALAAANRAVTRLNTKANRLHDEHTAARHEYDQAVVRRDYLATNPDLPQQQNTDTTPPSTSNGDPA